MGRIWRLRSIGLVTFLLFRGALASTLTSYANEDRAERAVALMAGAEQRFVAPDPAKFASAQQAVRVAAHDVDKFLQAQGEEYAAAWRNHLRWPLLEKNLGPPESIDYLELASVRRWLYSNRKGLEYPQFEELRPAMDVYLDAAYVQTARDLRRDFELHVVRVREECNRLASEPTDSHAAALGRTLGWFDRTQQLSNETAELRRLFFSPNIEIVVASSLAERVLANMAGSISQTVAIHARSTTPPAGLLGRSHDLRVSGVATTAGKISVEFPVNDYAALLHLVYQGTVESHCRADAGPAVLQVVTRGVARAVKEVSVDSLLLETRPSKVTPTVQTKVARIDADNSLARLVAERRSKDPDAQSHLRAEARRKTSDMLQEEMDRRVDEALQEIRQRLAKAQTSFKGFAEVLAPIVREGAAPRYVGARTNSGGVVYAVESQRRNQGGAPLPCPVDFMSGDVQIRFHVSAFENLAETIMAGKTFTDVYFMNYAKILQAELPVPLMVHSRASRWSVVAAKERPLELSFPSRNVFQFTLRTASMRIDDEELTIPATAQVRYQLQANEWGEYALHRQGELELTTDLPTHARVVLYEKLNAFFAPLLNGGGVVLPGGGEFGKLQQLVSAGVRAEGEWFAAGVIVPDQVIADLIEQR